MLGFLALICFYSSYISNPQIELVNESNQIQQWEKAINEKNMNPVSKCLCTLEEIIHKDVLLNTEEIRTNKYAAVREKHVTSMLKKWGTTKI